MVRYKPDLNAFYVYKGGYLYKYSRRQACSYVVVGRVGKVEKARLTRKNLKRGVVVDAAVR